MVADEVVLSREGIERLKGKLARLRANREKIVEKLNETRKFGPSTETEHEEARKERGYVEARIRSIEELLERAELLEEENERTGRVQLGSRVQVEDLDSDEILEYVIVSSAEVEPLAETISSEAPVGRKLLGSCIGDVVEVEIPDGRKMYKILGIELRVDA